MPSYVAMHCIFAYGLFVYYEASRRAIGASSREKVAE